MRKSDKKIDNQLRLALTDVCEEALKEINGFQWLTHLVDYARFPESLKVVCIFDSNENLSTFMSKSNKNALALLIQQKLCEVGVNIKDMSAQVAYDTEENCAMEHKGKWAERLK
jgi:hypothetical protein